LCRRGWIEAAIEESDGDAAFIARALGDIARAKGMAELARETGLGRESLYKALSAEGNPQLSTVLKVAKALGLQLHVRPATQLIDVHEFEAMQSRLGVLEEVYKAEAQITQGEGISHEDAKKLVRKRIKSWK